MKKSRLFTSAATLATACILGAGLTGFAAADAAETNAVDVVAVLQDIAPDAVANVAASAQTDADTAVKVTVPAGGSVEVPKDPSDGLHVTTPGDAPNVTIGLPFADQADDAAASQKAGVVVYDNNNGSSTVPVTRPDGGVQITTVIDDANAPKRYAYPITVPGEQAVHLLDDGAAYIGSEDGVAISAYIPAPWAKDANGDPVATHFEVNGDVLTQVVEFAPQTAFPVVADPQFAWYWGLPGVKTTRAETRQLMGIGAGPTGPGGAAKACGALLKMAGPVGVAAAVLCGINAVSIMYNATKAYNAGQCAHLLISPGVIGTVPYKDSYCR
ncbi:hypothetical protein ACRAWB_10990 [Leifsonia poae]|uniref:hypothetical protein n=1 Tax=Leifsonia poae TaxID=110933 RepID=UPI003D6829C4